MIKLTQTVQKGGCAAKVAAAELRSILSQVSFPAPDKNVLVDGRHFDDAGIYKVSDSLALVQTLDFFTPIVDSPSLFGKIAAANAISDVYAMGGQPITAMAILAFPLAILENKIAVEVLQGASDVMKEAGVNLVGGHSIDDDTLKFGLSVTGFVHPDRVWSNAGAQSGDDLILTKGLGTGTLTAGLKRQVFEEADISEALVSMCQLNKVTDLLSDRMLAGIHAATDVTGFGLLGHGYQMAKASEVALEIVFSDLPVFSKAWGALAEGFLTKAHRTNAEYVQPFLRCRDLPTHEKAILFDPQTSGGLLLSVAADQSDAIVTKLKERFQFCRKVGRVRPKNDFFIEVI